MGQAEQIVLGTEDKRPGPEEWADLFNGLAARRTKDAPFWDMFSFLIRDAQVFEFGRIHDDRIKDESIRGGQLWGTHLNLPFNSVIYWYDFIPDNSQFELMQETGITSMRYCTLAAHTDVAVHPQGVGTTLAADFMLITPHFPHQYNQIPTRYGYGIVVGAYFCSLLSEEHKWEWYGRSIESPHPTERTHGILGGCADGVVALSMMLATRGIPLHVEHPPAKVNAKRAKRGRPPLTRVTHVDTAKYYEAMHNTAHGGTHASPVPHLRRGHQRHYQSGKVIWIHDMMINCRSLSELTDRDHYEVR